MDLLRIDHDDFTLQIDCDKFDAILGKARRNIDSDKPAGTTGVYSTYGWSEGVTSVRLNGKEIVAGQPQPALFFDNADYPLWVEFKRSARVREASFNSANRKVAENFRFHKDRQILMGFLNYGNEIGKSRIIINYTLVNGERRTFRFDFDVLSTKLDYHEHWREIVRDIEKEYRMLSIDFLKKTFHSFEISDSDDNDTPDLIWWQIFSGLREDFISSCKAILDRPRHRLRNREMCQRADRIKRINPLMENEYARHRNEPSHLYRTEVAVINNDTYENRFLKYAVASISSRHMALTRRLLTDSRISGPWREEVREAALELEGLGRHSFFRGIGPFKGLTHESLILQQDTNYSNIYRTWLILQQAYALNEGLHNLETKDIATLYEIWCFIQMKDIVRNQLGEDVEVDNASRREMNEVFCSDLEKGSHSRILFRKGDVELAEIFYNPKQDGVEREELDIENLYSKTVPQKPDIVMRLTKHDHERNMKLTYLFDAKYRIDGRDKNKVDTPPPDAINQMHRYRDAIYYSELNGRGLKKEIIGGYILFPGNGTKDATEVADFYRSIKDVNIGAFPLRPCNEENRALLDSFVGNLIKDDARTLLTQDNMIPQKGLRYEHDELMLGSDELCLVCYINKTQLKYVEETGVYYVRTGNRDGALPFDIKAAGVRKVVLFPHAKSEHAYVFDVSEDGPRIYSAKELGDMGFPDKADKEDVYFGYTLSSYPQRLNLAGAGENPDMPANSSAASSPFILRWSQLTMRDNG